MRKHMERWLHRASFVILALAILTALMQIPSLPAQATWGGSTATGFASGSGTASAPYTIRTVEQMGYFIAQLDNGVTFDGLHIRLESDLDLTGETWSYTAYPTVFDGTLDGGCHTITTSLPLLQTIGENGTVQKLNVVAADFDDDYVLCATNYGSVIACTFRGSVPSVDKGGTRVGMVCQYNRGTIRYCGAVGSLYAYGDDTSAYAGMAADNASGTIQGCFSAMAVKANGTGKYSGDFAHPFAYNNLSGITDCWYDNTLFTGAVTVGTGLTTAEMQSDDFLMQLAGYTVTGAQWVRHEDGYPTLEAPGNSGTVSITGYEGMTRAAYHAVGSVTLRASQAGGRIYYTTDGTDPRSSPTRMSSTQLTCSASLNGSNVTLSAVLYTNGKYGAVTRVELIYLPGAGTLTDPYRISTKAALDAVRLDTAASYQLVTDLTYTAEDFAGGGIAAGGWKPIPTFSGTFDGAGHAIVGLQGSTGGLFHNVESTGTVTSLRMLEHRLSSIDYSGAIANRNSGTITHCHASSAFTTDDHSWVGEAGWHHYVGGIVGSNSGYIYYSSTAGVVAGGKVPRYADVYVGGIVGTGGYVYYCTSSATIVGYSALSTADYLHLGGISGGNTYIYDCRSDADFHINASVGYDIYLGGLGGHFVNGSALRCVAAEHTITTEYSSLGGSLHTNAYAPNYNQCYRPTGTTPADYPALDFEANWMLTDRGAVPQGIMDADGHCYIVVSTSEPDCETPGETVVLCELCQDTKTYTFDALGHNYDEGICTRCGTASLPSGTSGTCGDDLRWVLSDDGTLTISGTGAMDDYDSAAPWNEWKDNITAVVLEDGVTSIGSHAFAECNALTSMDFGSVESIGDYAFSYCGSLTQVTLPATLTRLGDSAFADCSLESAVFNGDALTTIDGWAFSCCYSLQNIVLPNSVTTIGESVFANCSSLHSVTLGTGLTALGNNAFEGCESLTTVTFSGTDTTIGSYAFNGCTALKNVTLTGVTEIGEEAFLNSGLAGHLVFPDSLTTIGSYAFSSCSDITEITFGSGLASIGRCAFQYCSGVDTITFTGSAPAIGTVAFGSITADVYTPAAGWTDAHRQNYGGSLTWHTMVSDLGSGTCGDDLRWVLSNEGTLTISGTGAMDDYDSAAPWNEWKDNITAVVLEDGVTSIGSRAFYNCDALQEITIPDGVTTIGNYAFYDCGTLRSVIIGSNVTTIGKNAFKFCYALREITMPNSVITMEDGAFAECYALQSVTVGDGVTTIGYCAFADCTALTEMTIGDGVTTIDKWAFANCQKLKEITIPDSVTSIRYVAFEGCIALTSITFEGSAPDILSDSFLYVTATAYYPYGDDTWTEEVRQNYGGNITWRPYGICGDDLSWKLTADNRLIISGTGDMYDFDTAPWEDWASVITAVEPDSRITRIGDNAFAGCTALTEITLPESLTAIGDYAFAGCTALTEIALPESLTAIGDYAFAGCTALRDPGFNAALVTISAHAYENCVRLATPADGNSVMALTLPATVTSVGDSAFRGCSGISVVSLGNVETIGSNAFADCTALKILTIPTTTVTVGDGAFRGCTALTEVEIYGAQGLSLGANAFGGCTGLKKVRFWNDLPTIASTAFTGVTADCSHPDKNSTWTTAARQNYGGTLNWLKAGGTCGYDLTWGLNHEGLLKISGTGYMSSYSYSDNVSSAPWFASYRTQIKAVEIENGVSSIGSAAFAGLTNLTSVIIPDSVAYIDHYAFRNCRSLASITLGSGVTSIGDYAFYGCKALESVRLNNVIAAIGSYAFADCTKITQLVLPSSMEVIEDNAFNGCTALASVNFPYGLTTIDSWAFENCDGLTSVILPDSLTTLSYGAFAYCDALETAVLPDSLSKVESRTFSGCSALKSVKLPEYLLSIGDSAFNGCAALESIALPDTLASIGTYAFYYCSSLQELTLPMDIISLGESAFGECCGLQEIHFTGCYPMSIEYNTFQSVTAFCFYPAYDDSWDTEARGNYGGTLTWIMDSGTCGENLRWLLSDNYALYIQGAGDMTDWLAGTAPWYEYRTMLRSVSLSDGITHIGAYAFEDCAFTGVSFPASVTSVSETAFTGVTATACYPYGVTFWTPEARRNYGGNLNWISSAGGWCGETVRWELNNEGDFILSGSGQMEYYHSNSYLPWYDKAADIRTVTIGDGITGITDYAFQNCTALESVTIGSGLEAISAYAFAGCTALQEITIPGNVKTIDTYAFDGCSVLKDLTICDGVEYVKQAAFRGSALTAVLLPDSIRQMEFGVFQNTPIRAAIFTGSYPELSSNPFYSCNGLIVYYPADDSSWDSHSGFVGVSWRAISAASHSGSTVWALEPNGTLVVDGDITDGTSWAAYAEDVCGVRLLDGVTEIGSRAFADCTNLQFVEFIGSAPVISADAFDGLTAFAYRPADATGWNGDTMVGYGGTLTWGTIASSGIYGNSLFWLLDDSGRLLVTGNGSMSAQDDTSPWYSMSESIRSVIIGDGITDVKAHAFSDCCSMTDLVIGSGVQTIGNNAFENCTALETVTLGSALESIGEKAFYDCRALRSITLPNGLETIGSYAFGYCSALQEIAIPDSVTSMGSYAFSRCTALESVTIGSGLETIPGAAFSYCSALESVVIPGTVKTIGSSAFYSCTALESITLPNGLETIDSYAFGCCSALQEIAIPDSITSMGSYAFSRCTALESVTIGSGLDTIPDSAFSDCTALESVVIPGTVKAIGSNAFYNCTALKTIIIGNGVETIGTYAFCNCSSLTALRIPASVTSIGDQAFRYCSAMQFLFFTGDYPTLVSNPFFNTSLTVCYPADNDTWPTESLYYGIGWKAVTASGSAGAANWALDPDGILLVSGNISGSTPWAAYADDIVGIRLLSGVTEVNSSLFTGCTNLQFVEFSGSAPAISDDAFAGLTVYGLYPDGWDEDTLTGYGGNVTWITVNYRGFCTDGLFLFITDDRCLILCGQGAMQDYSYSYDPPWYDYEYDFDTVIVSDGITHIGSNAFDGFSEVTSIILSDSVKTIGSYAFSNCTALESLTLGGVKTIGECAFYECSALTGIAIPGSVTSIGNSAFSHCTALENVSLGSTETIGNSAFYGCTALTEITVPDSVATLGSSVFRSCTALKTVTLGGGLETIPDRTFYGCTALTEIFIPDNVERIEEYAFYTCTGLTAVTISDSVNAIGSYAFYGCNSLTGIAIPGSVTSIGSYAFQSCSNLTELTIGNGVESIGSSAFSDCSALKSITFPASLISVENYAFRYCSSLKTVTFTGNPPAIGSNVFGNITVCYPYNNTAWTDSVRQSLSSSVTWKPYGTVDAPVVTAQLTVEESLSISLRWTDVRDAQDYVVKVYNGDTLLETRACSGNDPITFYNIIPGAAYRFNVTAYVYGLESAAGVSATITTPSVFVVEQGECGENLTWTLTNTGVLTITGEGEMQNGSRWSNLSIPVNTVIIPDGITSISSYAFQNCTALTEITIPDSVKTIGERAFYSCYSLESVTLGCNLESIGANAFQNCTALTEITIPGSVSSMGSYAFADCIALESATFVSGVQTIGSYAFYDCSQLKEVTIPASVKTIGDYAFYGCTALEKAFVGSSTISANAFYGCSRLKTVTFSAALKRIDHYAFYDCEALTTITFTGDAPSTGTAVFGSTSATAYYPYPNETWTEMARYSISGNFIWVLNGEIPAPEVTVSLNENGHPVLCWEPVPCAQYYTVNIIGSDATNRSLPVEGTTFIYNHEDISPSTTYTFTVTAVVDGVAGTTGESVSITTEALIMLLQGSCGDNASFRLTSDGVLTITGTGSMNNYNAVLCGSPLRYAPDAPWQFRTDLIRTLVVGDGITSIGWNAFYNCDSLTEISLGSDVQTIGVNAFYDCDALETLAIGGSVTTVGTSAFQNCSALTTLTVGDSVTVIGNAAFKECAALKSITFGTGLQTIDGNAFYGCTALETVTFTGDAPSVGFTAFDDVNAIAYYPYPNETWTEDARCYIGSFRWVLNGEIPAPEVTVSLDSNGYPVVRWTTVHGASKYILTGYQISGDNVVLLGSEDLTGTEFVCAGADPNTTYGFTVAAMVEGVEGSTSQRLTVTTPALFLLDSGTCGEALYWKLDTNGVLTIFGEGEMYDYQRYVTPAPWENHRGKITTLVVESGVTSLGRHAFAGCGTLTAVTLPDTLETIGFGAFAGCSSLTEITIPTGALADNVFDECYSLGEITFGSGVTLLGADLLGGGATLHTVTFLGAPPAVAEGVTAPFGDSGANTVTAYYPYTISGWTSEARTALSSFFAWTPVGEIPAPDFFVTLNENGYPVVKWEPVFGADKYVITGYHFPDGTTELLGSAEVTGTEFVYTDAKPNTVYAFTIAAVVGNVEGITSNRYDITTPLTLTAANGTCGENIVWTLDTNGLLTISGTGDMENYPILGAPWYEHGSRIREVVIGHDVTSVGDFAFYGCDSLTTVSLGDNIAVVGASAFQNCTALTAISFPPSVTVIGENAFLGCSALETVTLRSGLQTIGANAFNSCIALTEITIPDTVTAVEFGAFSACTALESITFTGDAPAIDADAFVLVTAKVTYPKGNPTWNGDIFQNYGGSLTWPVAKLQITGQPMSLEASVGEKVTFTVTAAGEGLNYQWQYKTKTGSVWNNSSNGNPKTDTLTVEATEKRDGYQYRCIVTDVTGKQLTSDAATLTVKAAAPVITGQPVSVKASVGEKVTFTVTAAGEGLNYQWQYKTKTGSVWNNSSNGNPKTDTLTVEATEKRDGYQYRCIVTDATGKQLTSDAATLTVKAAAPVITGQPASVTKTVGETAKFSVKATGSNLTYQWQYRTSSTGSWNTSTGTGAKTATLSVAAEEHRDGYQYRCKVSSSGNSVYTDAATLKVIDLKITSQPASVTKTVGETAKFSVKATGSNLTYQWQYRTSSTGSWNTSTGTGAKTATLSVAAEEHRDGYQYRCKVSSNGNSVYTDAATLKVVDLKITSQPASVTKTVGETAKFSVKATGSNLTYQWQYKATGSSWNNSSNGKTASLTVEAAAYRNGYQYRCIVTDADGNQLISDAATLSVSSKTEFAIIGQPVSVKASAGEKVTFSVTATGESLTYQWQYKTKTGSSWNNSSNGKTASLTVEAAAYRNGYQYRCIVTDADGNQLISDAATLTVNK